MPKMMNSVMTNTTMLARKRTRSTFALSVAMATTTFAALLALAALAPAAGAQGSRKDDIVIGTTGHPVSGATVRVCQAGATGTPCSPLAALFTDATMTVPSANPF
jgi:hypothetical protein